MEKLIYLDNAATTFPKSDKVYEVMDQFLRTGCVNAGRGSYKLAREATKLIDETKQNLLRLTGLPQSRQVIFSPSATIALNQIIFGLEWNQFTNVYVTPFEHNAIMRPLQQICDAYNAKLHIIPFNTENWELDFNKLEYQFAVANPDYIFMSHVSNVTGFILPCDQIIKCAKKYDTTYILDSSQALSTIPMSEQLLECDFIVFAGHKSLYGPMGIGGFISKDANKLKPVILGGTGTDSLNLEMPATGASRYEAATYNVQAVAGLHAAIEWLEQEQTNIYKHEKDLTKYLINRLKQIPEIQLYLPANLENHCGIVSFNIQGWLAEELGTVLDEDFNIAVRTGYHCAPLVHDFISTRDKLGTVRVSIGYFNCEEEINQLVEAINELIEG